MSSRIELYDTPPMLRQVYEEKGLWRNQNLPEWFIEVARIHPTKVAVVVEDRAITFETLEAQVRAVAGGLREAGLKPGEIVAYQLPNCLEAVVLHLAVWYAGAITLPVFIKIKETDIVPRLLNSQAAMLVVPVNFNGIDYDSLVERLQEKVPSLRVCWGVELPEEAGEYKRLRRFNDLLGSSPVPPVPTDPNAPVQIMFTSGTEAAPKGVIHTTNTVVAHIRSIQTAIEMVETDTSLIMSPMTMALGLITSTMAPLLVSACVVIQRKFSADGALALCSKYNVTLTNGTSTHYDSILNLPNFTPEALRSLRLAGLTAGHVSAEVAGELYRILGVSVMSRWGMTEGSFTSTAIGDPIETVQDTCGSCRPGVELQTRTADGRMLPKGETGVLWVRGPSLFRGYLNDSARTNAVFDSEGWFCTGDMGWLDEDGYLHFTGRQKDIIIRGGMNISPSEVEKWVEKYPGIRQCALVAMPDRRLGERACMFVTTEPQTLLTLEDIVAYLRGCGISDYKLPERLEIVDEMPMTPTMKIAKEVLRQLIVAKLEAENGAISANAG